MCSRESDLACFPSPSDLNFYKLISVLSAFRDLQITICLKQAFKAKDECLDNHNPKPAIVPTVKLPVQQVTQ